MSEDPSGNSPGRRQSPPITRPGFDLPDQGRFNQENIEPIRLAHVIDNLRLAGTQTALLHLVAGLAGSGYQQRVYYFNNRHQPNHIQNLEDAGAEVIHLGRLPFAALRLLRQLRRWQPSIVQTFLPASDVIGRSAARLARVPAVVTSIRARNIDKPAWLGWLDRRTMRWADQVIFNAESVVPYAMGREGVRAPQVRVVPNGVRIPAPSQPPQKDPGAPFVVGTVGRLRPQKDCASLLEAAAILQDQVPIMLWIIGDGELFPELETQTVALGLLGQVRFLGARQDLDALYPQMDLYAHPARFEGMPNAVMEAMAHGLPVVATAIDGTIELIDEGRTGWLVPPGDPAALAGKILAALKDRELANQIGQAAAKKMARDFSVEKMVAGFDRVYRGILGY
jgi:glycosyltransferase involved in cell wall biosynthesis